MARSLPLANYTPDRHNACVPQIHVTPCIAPPNSALACTDEEDHTCTLSGSASISAPWFSFCSATASTPASRFANPTPPTPAGWSSPRLGHRRAVRRARGPGLRQPRRASESCHHARGRGEQRQTTRNCCVSGRRSCWAAICGAALMVLHYAPHWSHTPDPAAKLGIFCTGPAIKSPLANIVSEIIGTMVLVIVAGAIFSHGVSADRSRRRHRAMACRQPRVGHRPLARRNNRLCHQSRARLGPRLVHALLPIPGQGRFQLELCADPRRRRPHRRRARRSVPALRTPLRPTRHCSRLNSPRS